jgi:hypothetical protein
LDELREVHLGTKRRRKAGPGVGERLQAAYEKVVAKKAKGDGAHTVSLLRHSRAKREAMSRPSTSLLQ